MLIQKTLIVSLALTLYAATAGAGPIVYVVSGSQFGIVDVGTGAFQLIGPVANDGAAGLVNGPNGSLLTLTFEGNLDSINPVTGVVSQIGATGLADCSTPSSTCGPTAANSIGQLGSTIYATDLNNDLYSVNPLTGAVTLIGPTGIPAVPATPDSNNPDGTFNAFDETLFSAGGNLYATFDAIMINPSPFTVTPVISPDLYEINTSTGVATLIGPTALTLGGVANVNGTLYAFDDSEGQVVTLNLANGDTAFTSNFDPAAGVIDGAAATPEPASLVLTAFGIASLGIGRLRRRGAIRTSN